MTPWLDDGDIRLYHGDALEVLAQLPDESVDCVVTSPPYWGLRDYGTGSWDGGNPDCDHTPSRDSKPFMGLRNDGRTHVGPYDGEKALAIGGPAPYRDVCAKCGARRTDQQLGLEPTPDQFVQNMVAVFREVRRVLAAHGTCWVNLGDSYAHNNTTRRTPDEQERELERDADKGYTQAWQTGTRAGWRDRAATGVPAGLKEKDMVGIPWRVAFALQQDGWYLRSDIIWAKPNPMPESVTDRPTKSHEYLFLLTKQPRYWFDAEAVREQESPNSHTRRKDGLLTPKQDQYREQPDNGGQDGLGAWNSSGGRNIRSVWQIATQPYPEAHFATFPEELARRAILAGCPTRVCRVCGRPSERIVETNGEWRAQHDRPAAKHDGTVYRVNPGGGIAGENVNRERRDLGWSDCGHNNWRPGQVLDPFIGSGTVAKVARDHGRHSIGIDLNETYLELAARRLQQLSLLT